MCNGVTDGGAECPPETSDWEISADLQGKERGKEKRENGAEKKENQKREGGKLKMEGGKFTKWGEDPFFLLFTFEHHWNLFWVYQNGSFLPGKNISRHEKIRKNDAPSEKYSSYAPDCVYT